MKKTIIVAHADTMRQIQKLTKIRSNKRPKNVVVHAFKVVKGTMAQLKAGKAEPPMHTGTKVKYGLGKTTRQKRCSTDPRESCGVGLHVATREWCHKSFYGDDRRTTKLCLVEIKARDVAVTPGRDSFDLYSKFRVRSMKILRRVRWDRALCTY